MADTRRYVPNQQLDLDQIMQEAQYRWLRPAEICEILRNYQTFQLTPDPPVRPPAGSLFLFDRKVLRYFRKDGHRWRKKKDGKTIKEAHEKLKAGCIDVLHCYYAHGEDNENFQRRSYWMLDKRLENIVLVHYREVKEGYKQGVSRLLSPADPGLQLGSPQTTATNYFEQSHSASLTGQASYTSSPNAVGWHEQRISSELGDADSGVNSWALSLIHSARGSVPDHSSVSGDKLSGLLELSRDHPHSGFHRESYNLGTSSSIWTDGDSSGRQFNITLDQKFLFGQPDTADFLSHKLTDARLDADRVFQDVACARDKLLIGAQGVIQEHNVHSSQSQFQNYSSSQAVGASRAVTGNSARAGLLKNDEAGELKKLDSFDKWMDKEIGGDCDHSLMASDSGNYWNTLDAANNGKEVSSLSRLMQLDMTLDSLSPSLSQEQLFSIHDFAPEWAYSGIETKVLIMGTFLEDKNLSTRLKWCCMFGEIEVSAEVLSETVIRCQVPLHGPGRVPFYVTCSNRLACSEIREFEYRENPSRIASFFPTKSAAKDEAHLQVQFTKMLSTGLDRKWLDCSAVVCDKCKVKTDICLLKGDNEYAWESFIDLLGFTEDSHTRDFLIENMLKDKLYEWLVCKTHEGGKGPNILDDEGQGVIHLAAALGYEWALGPIVAAGVTINFRDARGRTALHWASHYGSEEVIVALVRLGAASGAVDDPTPAFPGGQTAADLASSRGHKGIAGYLAEADLTSHLRLLTVNEDVMDSVAATVAAEKSLETVALEVVPLNMAVDDDLALKGSLAAVRKSAHAAALIQAAFRARSFHQRQLKSSNDVSEVSLDLVTLGSLNKVQKMSHFEDYLHSAAIKIQQKYRGWKGRKEFLKIRNRIVKIQAHVRGHQVRKHYKKVVWSVCIVEKAILRWRRRKPGLRGFRTEKAPENRLPDQKNDEYEFLRIGRKQKFEGVEKALARVQSMVRHPEARDQYMRLVAKFENFKLNTEGNS